MLKLLIEQFVIKISQGLNEKGYQGDGSKPLSSGNNGYSKKGTITYPAVYDSVIAVGADILSTVSYNSYASYSGTSIAAPHVAGVAALVFEAKPNLTNVQLRNL